MQEFIHKITEVFTDMGADLIGFSYVYDYLPDNLKNTPYAITVGVRLSDNVVSHITREKPSFDYFQHYRAVNALIDQITLRGSIMLQREGYNSQPIAASQTIPNDKLPYHGLFQHKTAAVLSGLGRIGKSDLFLSNEYGPRVRLGTLLTDMPVAPKENQSEYTECGECNECVKACPANAIKGCEWHPGIKVEEMFDADKCNQYMRKNFMGIGRGSVCGICMMVCKEKGKGKNE